MGSTLAILNDILQQSAPNDQTLDAVRARRDEVLRIVHRFPGVLRTYQAGSVAQKTTNYNADADGGAVLDRRSYPELGPDGRGEKPDAIVQEVRSFVTKELKRNHPDARFLGTKRGMKITYHEPLASGYDPTVDLIIALTSKGEGLWIPNLELGRWDVSHPERHTELMRDEPGSLRRTRAKVVRLAKAWNHQYSKPGTSSFNITALALQCLEEGMGVASGLEEFFIHAARELPRHLTADPAGVSPPIKLLIDRDTVVNRLCQARDWMNTALDQDDIHHVVEEALSHLFYEYVEPPAGSKSKAGLAHSLKQGNSAVGITAGLLGTRTSTPIKTTRAYGFSHRGTQPTDA